MMNEVNSLFGRMQEKLRSLGSNGMPNPGGISNQGGMPSGMPKFMDMPWLQGNPMNAMKPEAPALGNMGSPTPEMLQQFFSSMQQNMGRMGAGNRLFGASPVHKMIPKG